MKTTNQPSPRHGEASFILHSESGLGHDASADLTAEADHRISAPKDSISLTTGNGLKTANTTSGANKESGADDISQKVKLEDFSDILKDTRSAFFTPDSPTYEPIIVLDESKEEEDAEKDKDTEDTSKEEMEQGKAKAEVALMKAKPSYPDINYLSASVAEVPSSSALQVLRRLGRTLGWSFSSARLKFQAER
ncbi:hypothetical protein Tco_1375111 [Tanacetum coccineum]